MVQYWWLLLCNIIVFSFVWYMLFRWMHLKISLFLLQDSEKFLCDLCTSVSYNKPSFYHILYYFLNLLTSIYKIIELLSSFIVWDFIPFMFHYFVVVFRTIQIITINPCSVHLLFLFSHIRIPLYSVYIKDVWIQIRA